MRTWHPAPRPHTSRRRVRPAVALAVAALGLAACGDAPVTNSADSTSPTETFAATPPTTVALVKPTVSLPAALPSELIITDLSVGSGPAAVVGDTVMVHYVGVRTATGEEFDNSFDRGTPLEVSLGAGQVITGWDQGLVGVQAGGRRQLDIPAALAYGEAPPTGGPIMPGDALTFVVDVVAVLPTSAAADEPVADLAPAANVPSPVFDDLIVGSGEQLVDGRTVAVHVVSFRADTAERLASTWGGTPLTFSFSATTDVYPGLLAAVEGMQVGGRRLVQIPYSLMFDGLGSEGLGLPPSIDLVVLIDLVSVY